MLQMILGIILFVLLILVILDVIVTEFPSVEPFLEELKEIAITVYHVLVANYGVFMAVFILFALFILIGTSSKK